MRLKICSSVLALCCCWTLQAQQLSPSIITPFGDYAQSSSITLEWTLGEIAIETLYGGEVLLTEGFHQPAILIVEPIQEIVDPELRSRQGENDIGDLKISVTPNPVRVLLQVTVQSRRNQEIFLSLIDFSGKTLLKRKIDPDLISTEIDFGQHSSGMYLLKFSTLEGQLIQTFKVTKL